MKKSLISGLIFLTILVLGCSQSEIIGYTYDLNKESNQVRLEDIYSYELLLVLELKDNKIFRSESSETYDGYLISN